MEFHNYRNNIFHLLEITYKKEKFKEKLFKNLKNAPFFMKMLHRYKNAQVLWKIIHCYEAKCSLFGVKMKDNL